MAVTINRSRRPDNFFWYTLRQIDGTLGEDESSKVFIYRFYDN